MRKFFLSLVVFCAIPYLACAQGSAIDTYINNYFAPVTKFVSAVIFAEINFGAGVRIPFVLIWLIGAAAFFTVYLRFINLRAFRHAIDVVRGCYDDPNHRGEVSHFQALTAALSGTVGIGNIAGVALAVSMGGPGATFWMIIAGLLGMSSKLVECTLGVKYRQYNADSSVSGGPMYYLDKALSQRGLGGLGKTLAVIFAISCVGGAMGGGNMIQVNQAAVQFNSLPLIKDTWLAQNAWAFGVMTAALVGLVIIGGIKSIVKVTDKIVPLMVAIYLGAGLVILGTHFTMLPSMFYKIVAGAFAPEAMYGGFVGVMISGFRRAAFSNEAGIGSASIAHSAAKTDEPVSEGIVALLEPFIDTVVICTMTALVIISTNSYQSGITEGIPLTSRAFASVISWFPWVLSVAVMLFALSTMISWSYYGLKAWTYLFGDGRIADVSYKLLFCTFVVIGASLDLKQVFDFGDAMIFAMCFPNLIGLYILAPEVRRDVQDYFRRIKSGEIKRYH